MKTVLLHDQPLSGNGNRRTAAKRFGRGRITGLALIALLTLGLGYLHFAGGSKSVSVPAGAHAGQLTLKSCNYTTENGTSAADCGTLVVPENRHDPNSRLIALPVTRIRAHSAHPGVPIFRLQGGPGITNMEFPDASRFSDKHDVVLVGYRGVDGSTPARLPGGELVTGALARPPQRAVVPRRRRGVPVLRRPAPQQRRRSGRLLHPRTRRRPRTRPARPRLPPDRPGQRKRGHPHRDDLRLALPESIHRSVMIGVNPPGNFLWDAKTTGEQIRRYAATLRPGHELS